MSHMDGSPLLTWIVDSGKRESVHRNAPGLSAKDSELGHLERRSDADGDWSWGYVIDGGYNMAASYAQARRKLEEAALKRLPPEDTTPCGRCPHPKHTGKCQRAMSCACEG
jgi:hypothetical protein